MTERFAGEFDRVLSGVYDNGEQLTNFEVVKKLNELHKKNERFESMLNDFIRTERTEIGKSVLKQLKEALEL